MMTFSARLASLSATMLFASAALAAEPAKPAADASSPPAATPTPTPAPTTSASSGNKITTPLDDLGLRKEAIPPALQEAVENVYSMQGLNQCSQIIVKVDALNAALGKDIDLPQDSGSRLAATDLADFAASSVIPFRGLIREVTGASNRKRQLQEAVLAGFARRAFLKGYGRANYCEYPARPATLEVITTQTNALIASLEPLCGPLPDGQKRSPKVEWLNFRKCAEYKRAKEVSASLAAPLTAPTPTPAPAPAAATPPPASAPARRN